MFPDSHFYVVQDPWLLSPSIILAAIITGIRHIIYKSLDAKGHSFAKQQIEMAKPKWTSDNDNENDVNDTTQEERKDNNNNDNNTNIRPRITNEGDNNNNNNNNGGATQNGIEVVRRLSRSDSQTLLTRVRDRATSDYDLRELYSTLQLSRKQIKEVRRYRKTALEYESSVNKFLEVYFKLIMTTIIMFYGVFVVVLRDSAFWHAETLYTGKNMNPPQAYDNYMLFYYWLSLGYHVHRCIYQFFNHARSDFWAMFIHHWATICLITLSWFSGFCETGCLVMFLHDNGDVWLPLAKLFRYNGWTVAKDVCFVVFTVTWVQFRLYWFSTLAIWTVWTYGRGPYVLDHPWGFICFMLLCVLQILHIYWFILIMTIVKNLCLFGSKGVEDIRSDVPPDSTMDESMSQNHQRNKRKKKNQNNDKDKDKNKDNSKKQN